MSESDKIVLKQSADELSVDTPGHSCHLEQIRTLVCALTRKIGFPEDEVAKIEIAVDEVCSNIIQHAYAAGTKWCWPDRPPEIRMNLRVAQNQLIIAINHHGASFDYAACYPESIDVRLQELHANGYGIFIIWKFMDEVGYTSSDTTGNTIRLIKHLPACPPPPAAEIAARAYELYVQRGRREGHAWDDWLQAQAELTQRSGIRLPLTEESGRALIEAHPCQ